MIEECWDVVVVGGGPAGSAAAIRIARTGRRVLLLERDRGIVRKLCGEFLAPNAVEELAHLGVLEEVVRAGAVPIARWSVASRGNEFVGRLPASGLALSRQTLEPILRRAASSAGAKVIENVRVVAGERIESEFSLRVEGEGAERAAPLRARQVVLACGRAARIPGLTTRDEPIERTSQEGTTPATRDGFVAMKAHLQLRDGVALEAARVALYGLGRAYVGVVPVDARTYNVCFLARRDVFRAAGLAARFLGAQAAASRPWKKRWSNFETESADWIAVSSIDFDRRRVGGGGVWFVGDASATVSPLLGEGMAMALESGRSVADSIVREGGGNVDRQRWRKKFGARLGIGRPLQSILFSPRATSIAVHAMRALPFAGEWIPRKWASANWAGEGPAPESLSGRPT